MSKTARPHFSPARSAARIPTVSGIVLNYEGQSDLTFVRSPDLSARGMFVNTTRYFNEGAILNIRFRLALSGASVQARGEVRYCLPGVGIGLEFIDLDSATLELIDQEVALNHPARRRQRDLPVARPAAKPKRRPKSRRHM